MYFRKVVVGILMTICRKKAATKEKYPLAGLQV